LIKTFEIGAKTIESKLRELVLEDKRVYYKEMIEDLRA
jgi:hypothetical protein